jgi:DtxR family Mn-dependent transcriptional regulator
MDWAEIHEEAERLEHAISNRVIDRIDAFLGHPKVDPHGDQIPGADGQMRSRKLRSLNSVAPGQRATVAQIRDQNAEFLDFVSEQGIRPGNDLSVEDKNPHSDALILRMRGRPSSFALGSQAAEKILVEPK